MVLLDWPQEGSDPGNAEAQVSARRRERMGKADRAAGNAGLNLAVAWKLKGGSGCTCMDPMAYDLREHRIFEHAVQNRSGTG